MNSLLETDPSYARANNNMPHNQSTPVYTAATLPHEILLLIFSFVTSPATLDSASRVNKLWSPPAITTLYYTANLLGQYKIKNFVRIIRGSPPAFPYKLPPLSGRKGAWMGRTGDSRGRSRVNMEMKRGPITMHNNNGVEVDGVNGSKLIRGLLPRSRLGYTTDDGTLGLLVKKLVVSSADAKVILLRHIFSSLPNIRRYTTIIFMT